MPSPCRGSTRPSPFLQLGPRASLAAVAARKPRPSASGSRILGGLAREGVGIAVLATATAVSSVAWAQDGTSSEIVTGAVPSAFAFNYGEVDTTRSAAMGGALRAAGNGTTAPYMNPAGMATARVYHIEAQAQVTPEFGRQQYGGTIVDSVTSRLAGGLGVHGGFLDPDGIDRSWIDVRIALAYALTDAFSVGLGGRYMKVVEDGLGPLGDSKASGGLRDPAGGRFALENVPTFDAGLAVRLGEIVRLGLAGQNLSYPNDGILPTTFGGGVAVATEDFTVEADGLADFTSYENIAPRLMAGGELLVADSVPIRGGYRFDGGAASHAVSAGVGYLGREFSIEGAVRRTIVGPSATTVVFSIAYFLESSGLARAGDEF